MIFLRKIIYTAVAFSLFSISANAQRITRKDYIEKYKEIAIIQMKAYGIPASIILAQACLESGDGNSTLAIQANNHFGIKCHEWNGATIYHDDDQKNECFRKYSNPEDSFRDHSEFLKTRPRYHSLFNLGTKDYKSWAYGLKASGYATNPQYAQRLIDIIEAFQLYLYDTGNELASNSLERDVKNIQSEITDLDSKQSTQLTEREQRKIERQREKLQKKAARLERKLEKARKKEAKKAAKLRAKSSDSFYNRY